SYRLADARQRLAEGDHSIELRLVLRRAIAGVITVLLSPFRIPADRLNVSVRMGADPDVVPGRRDREGLDASARLLVAHRLAARAHIAKSASRSHAANART